MIAVLRILAVSLFGALAAFGIAVATPEGWAAWRVGLVVFCAAVVGAAVFAWVEEDL